MTDITDYPIAVLLIGGPILWLAARIGVRLSRRYPLDEDMRQDFSTLQAASLTLLGLIIAFNFSLAAGRYDQRKNLEEAEANAIGTEYVRAALLPQADAAKLRPLLRAYLDQRIQHYMASGGVRARDTDKQTAKLQEELWAAVVGPATATPTPIVTLVVAGMNDVLNAQSYTQAAWWNRIPGSAWGLMGVIALFCHVLVGYGSRSLVTERRLLFIFPAFIGIVFAFIADIDAPRHGIIRVGPQNLMSLASSLPPS